jgi:hypothetical protein
VELLLLTVVAGVSCHVALHERDGHLSQFEAFMLGEVAEALDVEGGEWEFSGEAAGGDPVVVHRARTAPAQGLREVPRRAR